MKDNVDKLGQQIVPFQLKSEVQSLNAYRLDVTWYFGALDFNIVDSFNFIISSFFHEHMWRNSFYRASAYWRAILI